MRNLTRLARLVKLASDAKLGLEDIGQVLGQTTAAGMETARLVAERAPAAARKLHGRLGIGRGGDLQDPDKRDAIANALRTATYTPLIIGAGVGAHAVAGIPDALAAKAGEALKDRVKHVARRVVYEPLVGLRGAEEAAEDARAFIADPLRARLDNSSTPPTRRQALKMLAHDALFVKNDVQQAADLTLDNVWTFSPSTYLGQKARAVVSALDQIETSTSRDKSRLNIQGQTRKNFHRLAGSRDALMRLNRVLSGLGGKLDISDMVKAQLADKIRAEGVHTDAQILEMIGRVLPYGIGSALTTLRQHGREKALRANPAEWNRLARMTDDEIARELRSDVASRVSRFGDTLRKEMQKYLLSATLRATTPPSSAHMGVRPQVTELRTAPPSSAHTGVRPQIIATR